MKKVLAVAALLAALSVPSFAYDWYAGGSFSYGTAVRTAFNFSPEVGYYVNDKLDVGVDFVYQKDNTNIPNNNPNLNEQTSWQIAPYAQLNIAKYGPLGLYLKGSLYYSREKFANGNDTENYGIIVAPNVKYALTDRITLFVGLNFLSLNAGVSKGKNLRSTSSFTFGADANNVINTGDALIGFTYNF